MNYQVTSIPVQSNSRVEGHEPIEPDVSHQVRASNASKVTPPQSRGVRGLDLVLYR